MNDFFQLHDHESCIMFSTFDFSVNLGVNVTVNADGWSLSDSYMRQRYPSVTYALSGMHAVLFKSALGSKMVVFYTYWRF